MPKEANNFDVFEDRVKSLLARWKLIGAKQPGYAIRACLQEINDDYTRRLMEEDVETNNSHD